MAKQKKAPDWFIENNDIREGLDQRVADILGVGLDWVRKQDSTKPIFTLAKVKELDKDKLLEIRYIYDYRNSITEYSWSRFRLDNVGNEFGEAEILSYNKKAKTIHIKTGIKTALKNMVAKITKQFGEIVTLRDK